MKRQPKPAKVSREAKRLLKLASSDLDREVAEFVAETRREPLPGQAEMFSDPNPERTA